LQSFHLFFRSGDPLLPVLFFLSLSLFFAAATLLLLLLLLLLLVVLGWHFGWGVLPSEPKSNQHSLTHALTRFSFLSFLRFAHAHTQTHTHTDKRLTLLICPTTHCFYSELIATGFDT